MATKFYLAEIPDDFPATNVKFENMTKPLLAIPAKMVDGKPITIVGYINAGQKNTKQTITALLSSMITGRVLCNSKTPTWIPGILWLKSIRRCSWIPAA